MSEPQTTSASTGPKTPEGKAISSQNALKHGLHCAYVYIPKGREEEFEQLNESYQLAFLKPNFSPAQSVIFDQLLKAGWTIERIQFAMIGLETGKTTSDPISHWDYEKLQKHLNRAEASFRFYLKQLREIQSNEILAEVLPELADIHIPALVNSKQLAAAIKRTAKIQVDNSKNTEINGV